MKKEELFGKLKRLTRDDKVLLLTHTDMDAVGATIVARLLFNNLDVKNCSNGTMSNDILYSIIDDECASKYDTIIACDISCSEEAAEKINKSRNRSKLILLDHHDTASHLNKYNWACVQSKIIDDSFNVVNIKEEHLDMAHSSGASLMYDFMDYCGFINDALDEVRNDALKIFIHTIASYDTWDWHNIFNDEPSYEKLDKLCDIYGLRIFEKELLNRINNANGDYREVFTKQDDLLLEIEQDKINAYMDGNPGGIEKTFSVGNICIEGKYYSIVYAYSDKYMQEVFSRMKSVYPNTDLYVINYGNGISMRTDTDLHIGNFVKAYGGGGHAGAGGFRIQKEELQSHLEHIFGGTIYLD